MSPIETKHLFNHLFNILKKTKIFSKLFFQKEKQWKKRCSLFSPEDNLGEKNIHRVILR